MTNHARIVAGWLNDLATLTAGTTPLADSKAKVAALTGMLAEQYPAQAFTRRSLEHVAAACTFFPSYGELNRILGAWWKDHRPQHPAVTHNRSDDFATEQRTASWRNMTPDDVRAKVRALDGHPMRRALGRVLAKGLEVNAPHLRPMLPPEFLAPDERQPAEVVPIETAAERFRTTHGRLPGQLTREQVAKMREDAKPQPAA